MRIMGCITNEWPMSPLSALSDTSAANCMVGTLLTTEPSLECPNQWVLAGRVFVSLIGLHITQR